MKQIKIVINELQSLDIPAEKRNEYLCAAIATGLACRLTLPTAKVKNIQAYFNEQHRRDVVRFVNAINEEIVFDAKEAINLTGNAYYLRYGFAFEPQAFGIEASLTALMGIDTLATPVKYRELLSDPKVAQVAGDVRRAVVRVYGYMMEKEMNEPLEPSAV